MINKLFSLLIISFFICSVSILSAQAGTCSKDDINKMEKAYCKVGDTQCWKNKGGYCVAYVQSKISGAPKGNADTWPVTVQKGDIKKVKKGYAALFNAGGFGHVAYVESVDKKKKQFTISEYNWGNCYVDQNNGVTINYHKSSNRTIGINDSKLKGFWKK